MRPVELTDYDGSSGFLVDSNVWIDCIDVRSAWHEWAVDHLQGCSEAAPLHINLVIYTELLVPGPDITALDTLLDVYHTRRSPLPWSCAAVANLAVLTRDETPYRVLSAPQAGVPDLATRGQANRPEFTCGSLLVPAPASP